MKTKRNGDIFFIKGIKTKYVFNVDVKENAATRLLSAPVTVV